MIENIIEKMQYLHMTWIYNVPFFIKVNPGYVLTMAVFSKMHHDKQLWIRKLIIKHPVKVMLR